MHVWSYQRISTNNILITEKFLYKKVLLGEKVLEALLWGLFQGSLKFFSSSVNHTNKQTNKQSPIWCYRSVPTHCLHLTSQNKSLLCTCFCFLFSSNLFTKKCWADSLKWFPDLHCISDWFVQSWGETQGFEHVRQAPQRWSHIPSPGDCLETKNQRLSTDLQFLFCTVKKLSFLPRIFKCSYAIKVTCIKK